MAGRLATIAPVGVVHNCCAIGRQDTGKLVKVDRLIARLHVNENIERPHEVDRAVSTPGRSLPDESMYWTPASSIVETFSTQFEWRSLTSTSTSRGARPTRNSDQRPAAARPPAHRARWDLASEDVIDQRPLPLGRSVPLLSTPAPIIT
jgi:hypothetical protein